MDKDFQKHSPTGKSTSELRQTDILFLLDNNNKLVGLTHILTGQREGAQAHSQTAADEREAILNTSHKVYIERS